MSSLKRKILVPISNRAHYGRLRSVLRATQNHPNLELQVIVGLPAAYSNFFLNIKHSQPHSWPLALPWFVRARLLSFLDWLKPGTVFQNDFLSRSLLKDGFPIHARLPIFFDGGMSDTMAKSVGLGILNVVDQLKKLKPDIVFVNADRFEMIAIAIAAAYLNIPIAHNEGGDISGTIDESVRHAITKLAHVHFTATETSRKRVIQMGENPKLVFNVGSPAIDSVKELDHQSPSEPYLVALLHPEATKNKEYNAEMAKNFIAALEEINLPTVVLGSNIDAGSDEVGKTIRHWRDVRKPKFAKFVKTLPPDDFYRLLAGANCTVGNSSSFIREGAYFGTPAVIVGLRQQNRDHGKNVIEVEPKSKEIKMTVEKQLKHGRYQKDLMFGAGDTGKKIADLLAKVEVNLQKEFYEN